ncbi:MAG: RluA family pseudouridine synthase [Hydrogenophaga sp.]|uniref:RluA family pseudouridine synthase n=1 Tax=Hydrogenophaga sp. TaxID=1904254 RepID=UPI00274B141A|nr:RluA family pseudouridine synthase [Hydrogenophaga sp.]MDP2418768.1 RluA family pseudouridine synthase [Hydrogenophaga sp.]MDZ4188048.1 RluA family pseudouridine synthase [Hydrogenophaga sp.]
MLVLVKPTGLLAVPGRGEDKQDCLSHRAQAEWPDALVVHRLDMSTSGLVVMARGIEAQRALSRAFEQRLVHKRYLAVVEGRLVNPQPDNGWNTIDLPLAVDWVNRPRSKVCHETGKPSLTRWRLAQPASQTPEVHAGISTRVELEPVTGRTHQLRLHLQALGHPIVGDALYADLAKQALAPRLLLHAEALEVPHPATGQMLRFHSPCPF